MIQMNLSVHHKIYIPINISLGIGIGVKLIVVAFSTQEQDITN